MNIGIDITSVLYHRGVSRYTNNLIRALLVEKNVEVSLFGSSLRQNTELQVYLRKLQRKFPDQVTGSISYFPPSVLQKMWSLLRTYPVASKLPKAEVFHSWDWLQPPDTSIPIVSTVHDVAILKFPDTAHKKVVTAHQASWNRLKESESEIIAVSNTTKKDLVNLLDFPANKIHVIHQALPQEFLTLSSQLTEEKQQKFITKYGGDKPYFLFVGTREPRKNLENAIKAWMPFADDFQLLIVGEQGWDDSGQFSHQNLQFLGKISDLALAALYSDATLFLYPSLYEGFGLPILEAFHYGVPVVTSNNSGMKEVAGNAAELVDPEDVESISQGISTIISENDDLLKKRLQKMIIRQHLFSWSKTAQETLQVYKKAISQFKS